MRFEDMIALSIILLVREMDSAIHFNNQSRRMAIEVCDETVNDLLAAKMAPI